MVPSSSFEDNLKEDCNSNIEKMKTIKSITSREKEEDPVCGGMSIHRVKHAKVHQRKLTYLDIKGSCPVCGCGETPEDVEWSRMVCALVSHAIPKTWMRVDDSSRESGVGENWVW